MFHVLIILFICWRAFVVS